MAVESSSTDQSTANMVECMLSDESDSEGPGTMASLVEAMLNFHGDQEPDGLEMTNFRRFKADVRVQSSVQLRGHDFLKASSGTSCLLPHVYIAMRSVRKRWRMPPAFRISEAPKQAWQRLRYETQVIVTSHVPVPKKLSDCFLRSSVQMAGTRGGGFLLQRHNLPT